jgi:hypothetical protein
MLMLVHLDSLLSAASSADEAAVRLVVH